MNSVWLEIDFLGYLRIEQAASNNFSVEMSIWTRHRQISGNHKTIYIYIYIYR